jgi:hypothetical protein
MTARADALWRITYAATTVVVNRTTGEAYHEARKRVVWMLEVAAELTRSFRFAWGQNMYRFAVVDCDHQFSCAN